jgi:hypothetical protein
MASDFEYLSRDSMFVVEKITPMNAMGWNMGK